MSPAPVLSHADGARPSPRPGVERQGVAHDLHLRALLRRGEFPDGRGRLFVQSDDRWIHDGFTPPAPSVSPASRQVKPQRGPPSRRPRGVRASLPRHSCQPGIGGPSGSGPQAPVRSRPNRPVRTAFARLPAGPPPLARPGHPREPGRPGETARPARRVAGPKPGGPQPRATRPPPAAARCRHRRSGPTRRRPPGMSSTGDRRPLDGDRRSRKAPEPGGKFMHALLWMVPLLEAEPMQDRWKVLSPTATEDYYRNSENLA